MNSTRAMAAAIRMFSGSQPDAPLRSPDQRVPAFSSMPSSSSSRSRDRSCSISSEVNRQRLISMSMSGVDAPPRKRSARSAGWCSRSSSRLRLLLVRAMVRGVRRPAGLRCLAREGGEGRLKGFEPSTPWTTTRCSRPTELQPPAGNEQYKRTCRVVHRRAKNFDLLR